MGRTCVLVFQADGGSVLLGRYADEEWSLPWAQIGGEFNVTESELEAAGRRLARELGLPSSAKELEYTGMCRFPELVRFSLQAPGLSALHSGHCGFDAVAFHRRDELPASLSPATRQLVLAWWPDDHELVHHDHEQGGAAGGAATSSARAPCPYKVHTYSEDGRRTGIVEKSALLELGAAPLPGGFEDIHSAYGELGPAAYYAAHGEAYRNPHEPQLAAALGLALGEWQGLLLGAHAHSDGHSGGRAPPGAGEPAEEPLVRVRVP